MSKKTLRLVLPALALSGLVAGAFAFASGSQSAAAAPLEDGGMCVAQNATSCFPPDPACIRVDYCTWMCP